VRVDAIDEEALTISLGRGCADTVPWQHDANSRIWFCGDWASTDGAQYLDGETVSAALLTRTTIDELPLASATVLTVELDQRHYRPYPPAGLLIGGVAYPEEVLGDVAFTWVARDRVMQSDQLFDTSAAAIGPESGVTYNVRCYVNDTLDTELLDTSSTSFTWAPSTTAGVGQVAVSSVRGGLESLQALTAEFSLGEPLEGDPHWANVATLLRFDGDLSNEAGGADWSIHAAGVIDTTAPIFGTGSLSNTARGGAISPSTETIDTNQSWTIDGYIHCTDRTPLNFIYSSRQSGSDRSACALIFGGGAPLGFQIFDSGANLQQFISSAPLMPLNTDVHIEVSFDKPTNTLRIFQAGIKVYEGTVTRFWTALRRAFLACYPHPDQPSRYLRGRMDEWRETIGVVRHTDDFTPPPGPFPNY
jgi:hypothetical protein